MSTPPPTKARIRALLGTLLFTAVAPCTVAGFVPFYLRQTWPNATSPNPLGWLLIVPAAIVLLESLLRFAWQGLGTAAPIAPTKRLVVAGLYRFVRNPMYLAVLSLVLGQALYFSSTATYVYAAFLALAFHLFVLFYEEPTLRRSYGEEYKAYCARVPRWLPWPQ